MHPLRSEAPSAERTTRRATAWVAVAVIHITFLSIFMISQALPQLFRHPGSETLILLPQAAGNSNAPAQPVIEPPTPYRGSSEVVPAPITIIPPPVHIVPESAPTSPGDILGAVGREIGCGANSFENLTAAEQLHCRRIPWHGVMLPNGVIVLDSPQLRSQFAPPPEERITGADAQRRDIGRAPDCPLMLNLPCMNSFMHRNN